MGIPKRLMRLAGRRARVDGIPFRLPVAAEGSPALMAVFPIDPDRARELLPGNEVHPLRLWNGKGALIITVIDYRATVIGKYIEFSIAIACTHGPKPAPRMLPLLFRKRFGVGQFVYDLPVSSEISVKGGKGIWGMPKHQANLDFRITGDTVSSQYDKDGQLAMYVSIDRPKSAWLSVRPSAVNYCQFRGMLMKSYIHFQGKMGLSLFKKGSARLVIGDHPRVQPLKDLDIGPDPIAVVFAPSNTGVLDDYFENWFLTYPEPPAEDPEGLESVFHLGRSEEWLASPSAPVPALRGEAEASRERTR